MNAAGPAFPGIAGEMAERLRSVLADVAKDARSLSTAACLGGETESTAA